MKTDRPAARAEGEADALRRRRRDDAAPFDSVPGVGFNTEPRRRGDRAASRDRSAVPGRCPDRRPGAEQHLPRHQPRVEAGRQRHVQAQRRLPQAQPIWYGRSRLRAERAGRASWHGRCRCRAERADVRAGGAPVRQPRIGLYQPWTGSMDEGWTRWVLEQYGFAYDAVHPEDFKTPLARARSTCLIIADDARVPVAGRPRGRGGRGGGGGRRAAGVRVSADCRPICSDFEQFVRGGGTRRLSEQREHVRHPAVQAAGEERRRRPAARKSSSCAARSSRSSPTPTHPVMAGHAGQGGGVRRRQPGVRDAGGFKGTVLAQYQETGSPLLSGYLIGEKYLNGKAAALDVQLDAGHVVLIGFRPEWRGQPFGTFRVLFNAALFHGEGNRSNDR